MKSPQVEPGEEVSALAKLGFVAAGVAAGGFIPFKGNRLWDTYLKGIRAVETGFPAAILRTFRISEFLSPLESWSKINVPQNILASGGKYTEYLQTLFGSGVDDIALKRSGSIFGEVTTGGRAVGMGIQITAGSQKGSAVADYFARLSGVELGVHESLNDALLRSQWVQSRSALPYGEWLENLAPHARREKLILGARYREKVRILGKDFALSTKAQRGLAKLETTGQLLRAKAATTAGRLNILLSKPLEVPVIGGALQKIPIIRSMAVKPGSAMQMLGRFTKKALVAGAVWKGLEYYDYLRAKESPWATALGGTAGAIAGGFLFKKLGTRFSAGGMLAGAAIGLYTALSPRFDQGLFHGAATMVTDTNLLRAKASQSLGITESLREQERVTPGLVKPTTALAFGAIGAMGVGFADYGMFMGAAAKERWKSGGQIANVLEALRETRKAGLEKKLAGSKIIQALRKVPGIRSLTKGPIGLGFLGGLAAWTLASSGLSLLSGNVGAAVPGLNLLGTTETPEELQEIYSGEKEVAIRKGRWWEFGRSTGYEGGRIEHFRPHFLHRLKTRAYQKGVYGSEEERWEYDPMLHPLKALFGSDEWKYHYEQKYQYERPAPLTGTYGEDVPFIGPMVAATLGSLLKPRKLVRPREWDYGEGEYRHLPDIRGETEPAYELGGLRPGAPVKPEEGSQLINELMYRRREAVGLVGFAEGAIQKAITGREEFFQNQQTMGIMGKETGSEYWLWSHLNLGGGMGTTEPIRRFIPHTRSYLESYNPLENTMPSWIPSDYFLDLKHGNPFQKIKEADIRLPGPGYAAIHPEVEGLRGEDYPLAHRIKILGDVAMWSDEYKRNLAAGKRNITRMSDQEKQMIKTTEEQVRAKKKRRVFDEYRFDRDKLISQDVTVTDVMSPRKIRAAEFGDMTIELQGVGAVENMAAAMERAQGTLQGQKLKLYMPAMESRRYDRIKSGGRLKAVAMLGDTDYGQAMAKEGLVQSKELKDEFEQLRFSGAQRAAGAMSEALLHSADTPLEMLTPISPASKLIRKRSAIEEYIATEAVGTGNAFWDRPMENFLRPAANMTLHGLGFSGIPEEVRQRRDINEYFDMLKWTKSERAEQQARQEQRWSDVKEQQQIQQETLFGVDVFGSPTRLMKALPRRERDFYASFVAAKTEGERQEIAQMIPDNERRMYLAQWLRQEEETVTAKKEAKIAQDHEDQVLVAAKFARKSEGFEISPDLEDEWMRETGGRIPYDEWIREKKAEEYFATHSLPGADWLGWHPSVDMDDVKLKYVEMQGLDHHDFDLWGARRRSLARKPYINEQLIRAMDNQDKVSQIAKTRVNAKAMAKMHGGDDARVNVQRIAANIKEDYDFDVTDKREGLVEETYKYMGVR